MKVVRGSFAAQNLTIRGWPHNPICHLYLAFDETVAHLCRDCPFSQEVWKTVNAAEEMTIPSPHNTDSSVQLWWDGFLATASVRSAREHSGIMIYSLWNIWKERNRRVFTGKRMTYREVANQPWHIFACTNLVVFSFASSPHVVCDRSSFPLFF